jgi:hypothetical protein
VLGVVGQPVQHRDLIQPHRGCGRRQLERRPLAAAQRDEQDVGKAVMRVVCTPYAAAIRANRSWITYTGSPTPFSAAPKCTTNSWSCCSG